MGFFGKKRAQARLAIGLEKDRVTLVQCRHAPGAKPVLLRCEQFRIEGELLPTLKRLADRLGLKGAPVSLALAEGEYQWLKIEAPAVPAEELKSAVRWKIKDLVDFKVDQAGIDVLEIPADPSGYGRKPGVFVAASARPVLERYVQLFDAAGFDLDVIEVPETALRNVAALFEPAERGVAMLSFDEAGGQLVITRGGELFSCRRIDVGLAALAERDEMNRQHAFDRVVLQLQRSLDSFEHQFHYVAVTQLVVMPMADDGGLVAHLADNLQLPVSMADMSTVVDGAKVAGFDEPGLQARTLATLGLALREAA